MQREYKRRLLVSATVAGCGLWPFCLSSPSPRGRGRGEGLARSAPFNTRIRKNTGSTELLPWANCTSPAALRPGVMPRTTNSRQGGQDRRVSSRPLALSRRVCGALVLRRARSSVCFASSSTVRPRIAALKPQPRHVIAPASSAPRAVHSFTRSHAASSEASS